jgi:hypothetical protein
MAQELRSDSRFGGRFFARSQCCYALLFFTEFFGVFGKNFAQTFVAGARPAAPYKDGRGLDSSGRRGCSLRGAHVVSAHRARRSAHAERSSRTESLQPPSAILLTFLGFQS